MSIEKAVISAELLIFIYLAGVVLFLTRFLFRVMQIYFIIRNNEVQYRDGYKLVVLKKNFSPFSFLNYVFISSAQPKTTGIKK